MSSLMDRLKNKGNLNKVSSDLTGIRDKFKPKRTNVLEQVYAERDKRSTSFGGRSIFNVDILSKLGISEFSPDRKNDGNYFFEILPSSFNDLVPYFIELAVHSYVGTDNDSFLCLKRYVADWIKTSNCIRCAKQRELYKLSDGQTTDDIKKLFPQDRVLYLGWDRSKELGKDEAPDYKLSIWNPPKNAVHSEIQKQVRDKITKQILDISDLSADGQGRTIYFDIEMKDAVDKGSGKKQTFPNYGGFSLIQRESPIPEEILTLLYDAIQEMEKLMVKGMKNPLEVLLNIHTDAEMEKSMLTEVHEGDDKAGKKASSPDGSSATKKPMSKLEKIKADIEAKKSKASKTIDLDELEQGLSVMELEEIVEYAITELKLTEDMIDDSMTKEELIAGLVEYVSDRIKAGDSIPF